MHEIQNTTEHVFNHHERVAAVIVSSDVESDGDLNSDDINDSEIEIDNVGDLNNGNIIENLAIDFQRMYINDSVDRSRLIECVICMNNICSIIIFPCKHFVMCKTCFDTHTGNLDICHFCPLCRTIIQSNSHVFLA